VTVTATAVPGAAVVVADVTGAPRPGAAPDHGVSGPAAVELAPDATARFAVDPWNGDASRFVTIHVVACSVVPPAGEYCPVANELANSAVRTSFVPDRVVQITIPLDPGCSDYACPNETVCNAGPSGAPECRPIADLMLDGGPSDAGLGMDAAMIDAGAPSDGGTDAGAVDAFVSHDAASTPDGSDAAISPLPSLAPMPCGAGLVQLGVARADWGMMRPPSASPYYADHFAYGSDVYESVLYLPAGAGAWPLGSYPGWAYWPDGPTPTGVPAGLSTFEDSFLDGGVRLVRRETTAWAGGVMWYDTLSAGASAWWYIVLDPEDYSTWRARDGSVPGGFGLGPSSLTFETGGDGVPRFSTVFTNFTGAAVEEPCVAPASTEAYLASERSAGRVAIWLDAHDDGGGPCISVVTMPRAASIVSASVVRSFTTFDALASEVAAQCAAGAIPDAFTSWQAGAHLESIVQFAPPP
jgi:hypothetical protein